MTIEIRPDVITNDYNVTHFTIEEGNDLSLTCEITGAEEKSTSVYWMYVGPNTNFTFNTNETTYNISTCRSRVPLFVKDIGHNESGTYYCVASDKNRPHAYQKMIKVNVIPMGKPTHIFTCTYLLNKRPSIYLHNRILFNMYLTCAFKIKCYGEPCLIVKP